MTSSPPARPARRASTRRLDAPGGGVITRTVLPGGLRIVTEAMPGVRSVSVGVWVPVGSRDESPSLAGTSHFLEHLLFKGTTNRSALDIASAMDAVGGEFNAFTEKEHTCFYATVLDRDLPLAIDIVSDVVLNATLTAQDVDVERSVVLEEIAMRDDDPADLVHDEFAATLFGDTPLGRPILGTCGLDRRADPPAGRRLLPAALHPGRDGRLGRGQRRPRRGGRPGPGRVRRAPGRVAGAPSRPATSGRARPGPRLAASRSSATTPSRPTSSSARYGVSRHDPRRFAVGVLSAALGGGMSSRLFQRIREERGLAYSVYSFSGGYADAGAFGVYAGCQPGKADEVLGLMTEELDAAAARLADRGRDRAGQGPDARRHRARPGGLRFPDDPHRQERTRLRRRSSASTSCSRVSTRSPPTTWPRWPPTC